MQDRLLLGQVGGPECGGAPPALGLLPPHHSEEPAGLPALLLAARLLPPLLDAPPLNCGGPEPGPGAVPAARPRPPLPAPARPRHLTSSTTLNLSARIKLVRIYSILCLKQHGITTSNNSARYENKYLLVQCPVAYTFVGFALFQPEDHDLHSIMPEGNGHAAAE